MRGGSVVRSMQSLNTAAAFVCRREWNGPLFVEATTHIAFFFFISVYTGRYNVYAHTKATPLSSLTVGWRWPLPASASGPAGAPSHLTAITGLEFTADYSTVDRETPQP